MRLDRAAAGPASDVIPNIVNSYVSLFKDTTLVFIVGIFDFLRNTIEASRVDPNGRRRPTSGYVFAAASIGSSATPCPATRAYGSRPGWIPGKS
jgi:hypothetical protein